MPWPALIRNRIPRVVVFCALMTCAHQLNAAQVVNQHSDSRPDAATEPLIRALVSDGSAAERRAPLASAPPGVVNGSLREALAARGRVERAAKRFAQAVACFEAARSAAEFLKDVKGEAAALNELGETSVAQVEFERAIEFFERGRALDAAAVAPLRLAEVFFAAGAVNFERGDYARAMELYRRSLEAYERNGGSKSQISGVVYGIGAIHYLKGEYAEATEVHRRSMRLAEESGESGAVSLSHFGLAADYRMRGDYAAAIRHYEQSLKLREQASEDEIRLAGGAYTHARNISTLLRPTKRTLKPCDYASINSPCSRSPFASLYSVSSPPAAVARPHRRAASATARSAGTSLTSWRSAKASSGGRV